ncbi:MAG: hypothetical protein JO354_00010 [Verrucomicrobia bacterium]|nr:hypothetical protein [Verrucomicrobiota bacterium]
MRLPADARACDVVLDPFCGCGTTIHAAQKLGRQWFGIDVTYLAINLIKRRLRDAFGEEIEFVEKGQPVDFASAKQLAENDKFQFQHWALLSPRPLKEGEGEGADRRWMACFISTKPKDRGSARNSRAGSGDSPEAQSSRASRATGHASGVRSPEMKREERPPREDHRAGERRGHWFKRIFVFC